MQLVVNSRPASKKLSGEGKFELGAGQSIVIETSPGGREVLSAECPAGKTWSVTVSVSVDETDA